MIKKLILIIVGLMLIASHSVMADWDFYGRSSDESFDVYIESSRIKRSGDTVKVWSLLNYKVEQVDQVNPSSSRKFLSVVGLNEYQCVEEAITNAHITHYTGKMGSGDVIFSETSRIARWEPIVPGSIGEGVMQLVCGKDQK